MAKDDTSGLPTIPEHEVSVPSRPTPLPSDSHLRGPDNYDVWCIQLRGLIGPDAYKLMTGVTARGEGGYSAENWDRLNEFAVSTISISCHTSVIHHVADCEYNAHAYWSALRTAFRPTDAQGSLRLLTRLWSLSLTAATPEAFDSFAKEYKATIAALTTATIDLDTIYTSHLLNALPPSLNNLQTLINMSSDTLPKVDTLLEKIRNEILREANSSNGSSIALAAAASTSPNRDGPPPSPCPNCKGNHWLAKCPTGDEYRKRRDAKRRASAKIAAAAPPDPAPAAPAGNLAEILASTHGVEAWLASPTTTPALPVPSITIDSGATHTMCGLASMFSGLRACEPSSVGGITTGQNGLRVTGVGSLTIRLANGAVVKVNKALLVPGISTNLLSTSQIFDLHGITTTLGSKATLSRNGSVVATGSRVANNLYRLDGTLVPPVRGATALLASSSKPELTTWHQRFAHLSSRSLRSLSKSDQVQGLEVEESSQQEEKGCNVCHIAHSTRLPFPRSDRVSLAPLELVHSDVLSISTPSLGGRRYVVTFTDDFSRMLWVEPLARKSDVIDAFRRFKARAETESGKKIVRFRSDNGGEYVSHAFDTLLAENGIARETPPPYSPQSNGVAERVNRTIIEGTVAFLSQAGAPKDLWAEALQAFVFVKNRSPHAALNGKVPLATWRDRPISVSMLRVWGCRAWHTVTNGRSKLDDKAIPLVFVGYDGDTAAYRLFDPITRKTIRSRDTRFVENEFPFSAPTPSLDAAPTTPITPADILVTPLAPDAPAPRDESPATPANRVRFASSTPATPERPGPRNLVFETPPPARPSFDRASAPSPTPSSPDPLDLISGTCESTLAEVDALVAAAGDSLAAGDDHFTLPTSDPTNHREAMRDVDSEKWREGEKSEFESLRDDYKVFHAVDRKDLPSDAKIIGCRFVYRKKKDQHGRVTGHKVRLVALGYNQRQGVDFKETFAPVAKFTSIRVLLALAARRNLKVHQADVDKAYLYGSLEEDIYVRIPEGIDADEYEGKVLKLDRALYGLKQAGRVWNHRIDESLRRLGYTRTKSDACIYAREHGGEWHYIALYVDDLLFVSPSDDEIARCKDGLRQEYGIKDLGEAKFILGIQIHRRPDGSLFLSQKAYLEDVLLRLGHSGCRTAPTPMIPNQQLELSPEDHAPPPSFRSRYLQAVGSLMYAMLGTRPDLAHVVGVLGRHSARPDNHHWSAVVRCLQYIKGTLDHGIEYVPDDSPMAGFEAYSDSDWGADPSTSRSTMGYVYILASGAVSWSSKLQPRVAGSSSEAEYLGMSHAGKELIFLSQLLAELGFPPPSPPVLFGDNQGANALSRDPQFHNRTRHLRLTEHFVREMVQQGMLRVDYIPTARMVADAMTKSLPAPAFYGHRAAMGVKALRARGGVAD